MLYELQRAKERSLSVRSRSEASGESGDTLHGIENLSDEVFAYVSAATPAVDWETFYDTGPVERERA